GFGAGVFKAVGRSDRIPAGFVPLPEFGIDKLEPQWCGGDLLLQLCSDDPLTLSHALRVLINDAKVFATARWTQRGFRNAADTSPVGTPRNLMGQLDGTANPQSGKEFDEHIWVRDGSWLSGGTMLVLRRIRMELEKWDILDRGAKELAVGRRLRSGAPLGGRHERDPVDLTAMDSNGLQVIPPAAHVRRAREGGGGQCLLRRGYNYDDGPRPDGSSNAGLIFAAYQADIERQFLPIQQRLAAMDALNEWTAPIGSAVFVLPPGCSSGGWLGETLLS
ncbi:MAG TPA: Dyp-type peroxidase, partial [Mycobacteriales bacterium]|nr:Dyp-type peroxidase [Mycobacteriales bacterium]